VAEQKESFKWDGVTGTAVERLRAPAPPPRPPDHLVKLAQQSWDGVQVDGEDEKRHVLRYQFGEGQEAKRDAFIKLIKAAGAHTTPPTTVTVVPDPDRETPANELLVAWRAGARRGRGATV
jgi:hypothetical protein